MRIGVGVAIPRSDIEVSQSQVLRCSRDRIHSPMLSRPLGLDRRRSARLVRVTESIHLVEKRSELRTH